MGAKRITTYVCAVMVIGDVALAIPVGEEPAVWEVPAPVFETAVDAEVIDTTGEVVS